MNENDSLYGNLAKANREEPMKMGGKMGKSINSIGKDNPREFVVKDSGERKDFAGGMVRDTDAGKTEYDRCFDGPMFVRWAEHLTKGAIKYPDTRIGVPNWTLASGDEELIRFRKSAVRHFVDWLKGLDDEDHAAGVFFNINGYEYTLQQKNKQSIYTEYPNAGQGTNKNKV